MANADQINAVSELVMNTLRGTVPQSRQTITLLKPHAFTSHGQTRPFGQTSTSPHDGSKRRQPVVRVTPML